MFFGHNSEHKSRFSEYGHGLNAGLEKVNYVNACQWLIAQLVERSLSVMKDPGSNLGADSCSFFIDL
jgi:hypothetical protein